MKVIEQINDNYYIILIWMALMLSSCLTTRKMERQLNKTLKHSEVFDSHFTGFALYDPLSYKMLVEYNADKYFIPASNTKIFTLYTSLRVLGDTLIAMQYAERNDSLYIKGMGYPLLMHPALPDRGLEFFLKSWKGPVLTDFSNFYETPLGPGWSWNWYPYRYATERAPFPLAGNLVQFYKEPASQNWTVYPKAFKKYSIHTPQNTKNEIRREYNGNVFYTSSIAQHSDTLEMPYQWTPELFSDILASEWQLAVSQMPVPSDVNYRYYLGRPADSVYMAVMQNSDNFFAEHLLLMCAGILSDSLKSSIAIDYAKQHFFHDMPDTLYWVDGSGLSRHNLFSPRNIIMALTKIDEWLPEERIRSIFPAGGVSGTIKNQYAGPDGIPYVYAKTGTLSNAMALSGYLFTRSGKKLIFSFLHNNQVKPGKEVRDEMQKVLERIYYQY
ncbi:MAG: D-alanyl-D-alanine carboxypeptidase [Cyclobacteriaceae bacterium]|nr:D-alanyl-D-alanine carboxypeptidase [Cyclobacteriaceae bacterium]